MASNVDFLVAFLLGILPAIGILWTSLRRFAPEIFGLLGPYSVGSGLVNADTGALIGFGASRGEMWRYFLRAIAVRFAYGAFLFPFILPGIPDVYAALSVTTAAGFGLLVYYYVYRRILPGTLPEELRREFRRHRPRASSPRACG